MAKDKSFGAKVAKTQAKVNKVCPVCKSAIDTIHLIQSMKNQETGSYRFAEKHVGVCKCNEKEIYS